MLTDIPWLVLIPVLGFLLLKDAALRVVEDYVIYPRLIGRDIHVHPLVVILAVLAAVERGGIAGISSRFLSSA